MMNKIIPLLPCIHNQTQVDFYTNLGFNLKYQYGSSYLIFTKDEIEIHFYATRQIKAHENSSCCYVIVESLESLYESFIQGFKKTYGKVLTTGFPKLSKIRELVDDTRFTLTDPSGNTFYIGVPKTSKSTFFRDLDHEEHEKLFKVLFDLIYSHEDLALANKMLPKLLAIKNELSDLDKAKLLLIEFDILSGLGQNPSDLEIQSLIKLHPKDKHWKLIVEKLKQIKSTI